ncbi:universal stress protein [Geodermatophilus aquaeductus]|uniref:Nucleotide-binding universal stress protein, UspA family n=1 Tax=Geodermatophilus aquaeductus TaxID=1564161 RepID=A0A521EBB5_9ACTN|nr:universal stress protein [Geodermatophilus aquaeductus]SMO81224.1 Nucleotide-binding universal stress protein, UspA family [Geodermatophilus aquaeductus]
MDTLSAQQSVSDEPVVVGVDGSPQARAALRAALAAAAGRSTGLVALSSYSADLYWLGGDGVLASVVDGVRESTRRLTEELVASVRAEVRGAGDVPVSVEVTSEGPASGLVARSAGAQLVVVGNRGRGAVRSALLGSVALHTVTHAHCPVLVVHPSAGRPEGNRPRVVVGVDGSETARAALATAVEEAVRAGAALDVLAVYALTDYWTDLATMILPSREAIREQLREHTTAVVEGVLTGRPPEAPVPPVEVHVVEGAASDVLVDRARDADLLVVGSSGRGSFRGLVMGSVALHCAMHAPCPVLVVHPVGRHARTSAGVAASAQA